MVQTTRSVGRAGKEQKAVKVVPNGSPVTTKDSDDLMNCSEMAASTTSAKMTVSVNNLGSKPTRATTFMRGITGYTMARGITSAFMESSVGVGLKRAMTKGVAGVQAYGDAGAYGQTAALKEMMENALDAQRTSYKQEMESRNKGATNWGLVFILFPCCIWGATWYGPLAGLTPLGEYSMQALVFLVNISGLTMYGLSLLLTGKLGSTFRKDYFFYGIGPTTFLVVYTLLCGIMFQYVAGSVFTALLSSRFVMVQIVSLLRRDAQVPIANLQIFTLLTTICMYLYICFQNGAFVTGTGILFCLNHNFLVCMESYSSQKHFATGISGLQAVFVNACIGSVYGAILFLGYDVLTLGHSLNVFQGMNGMVIVYGANFLFCASVFMMLGGMVGHTVLACASVCAMVFSYGADILTGRADMDVGILLCLLSVTCASFQIVLIKAQLEKHARLLDETRLLVERCIKVVTQV